jgi:hypothetical protein
LSKDDTGTTRRTGTVKTITVYIISSFKGTKGNLLFVKERYWNYEEDRYSKDDNSLYNIVFKRNQGQLAVHQRMTWNYEEDRYSKDDIRLIQYRHSSEPIGQLAVYQRMILAL